MAVLHIKALVDADGNLVIPGARLPVGTKVDVRADPEELARALQGGSELSIELVTADDGFDSSAWLKLAESSMDFWDNPVDDAVWNNA